MPKPQLSAARIREFLKHSGYTVTKPSEAIVLGVRGYFRASMGDPVKNDRGIYDDAMFVVLPDRVVPFNGNTDPSAHKFGIATLTPGLWRFIPGKHHLSSPPPKGRPAFRQHGTFKITRDGKGAESGYFGINFHDGGEENTSSLGCQTIIKSQWLEFRDLLYKALGVTVESVMRHPGGDGVPFRYILVTREELEKVIGPIG